LVKHDPVFTFKEKKVCTGFKNKGEQMQKQSFTKKQKKDEDPQKDFHAEVINDHEACIIQLLISVFNISQWLSLYNIKCKLV